MLLFGLLTTNMHLLLCIHIEYFFCTNPCKLHTHTRTSAVYNTTQWSGFGWDTSYIILTMYSAVNKKVSGWELAPCNNKMHELSTAGPSVSILLSWSDRFYCRLYVCVCVHSVFMGHRCETPYNNGFTWSIIIDCTFFPFALCLTLINVFYYDNILLLKHIVRWDFVLKAMLLLDQFYFCQDPNTLSLCRCDASICVFLFAKQGLIFRVYLSHAVMLRSHDHMNHCQQLRLINHSFTGREGGTESGKEETREW